MCGSVTLVLFDDLQAIADQTLALWDNGTRAPEPNPIRQSDMTKVSAGPAAGWAYRLCVIDCCTREIKSGCHPCRRK
jgi:hypothetical protein